ncbi:hypothetical protein WKC39_005246, partial [Escherichia coli]
MSKKFTKTILSSAIAGLLLVSGGVFAAEKKEIGVYTIEYLSSDSAKIYRTGTKNNNEDVLMVNTEKGSVALINKQEVGAAIAAFKKSKLYEKVKKQYTDDVISQYIGERHKYAINTPSLKLENLTKITEEGINKIENDIKKAKGVITSKTAAAYNTAIKNGVSVESALAAAKDGNPGLLNEFNRLGTNVN